MQHEMETLGPFKEFQGYVGSRINGESNGKAPGWDERYAREPTKHQFK